MHHIAYLLGLTSASDWPYLLWSGIEGDLQQITFFGAVLLWYQHRKCVSCWRFAKHHVEGTAWMTCHRHLTREHHDGLLDKYKNKHPKQHAFLATDRADSETLLNP